MKNLALIDQAQAAKIHKELMKDVLDQAWVIPTPYVPQYHFWWPWVKNYYGETEVGYNNIQPIVARIWIDQDLKKQIDEAHKELFNLRFRLSTRQLVNHRELPVVRKKIAQLKTIMRERELGIR